MSWDVLFWIDLIDSLFFCICCDVFTNNVIIYLASVAC
jgi:hypothetical protein